MSLSEIIPGVFRWSKFSEEKKMDFNGHAIALRDKNQPNQFVLIDPPQPDEEASASLAQLEADNSDNFIKAIILTNKDHFRDAEAFRKRFAAPLWAPRLDASLIPVPIDNAFANGDTLLGRFRVIGLDAMKSPGECALHDPMTRSMIIGDAVIGKVPGKLNLLPLEKMPHPERARESLRKLLGFDFDHLLIGDGTSILNNGKEVLAEFLALH